MNLATEKTEIVLLNRQRIPAEFKIMIGTDAIAIAVVEYTRLRFNCKLTFREQLQMECDNVQEIISHVSGLD